MSQVKSKSMEFSYRNISILSLSDEVLVMIFKSLNTEDKIVLSKVCRRFDGVLLDKTLCRDIRIAPEHNGSCVNHLGFYFQKRRQLIHSVNISSCFWIPMPKILIMNKNLVNLHSLHVINISLPVPQLARILKGTKQLRELSWSWQDDFKSPNISWSDVPSEERMALSGLEYLHVCLPDPWCPAAQELLLGFCSGLTHLTVQVDPALGILPIPKAKKGAHLRRPKNLKSLIVFQNTFGDNTSNYLHLESAIGRLMRQLWKSSGGCSCAWECLWTNAYGQLPWTDEMFDPEFKLIPTHLKSIVLCSDDFAHIQCELPISQLVIMHTSPSGVNLPPLKLIAPNLQQLAFITNIFCKAINSWINTSLRSSEHLSEINLTGVHYCGTRSYLECFWVALRSLRNLKKLSVAPCILPKIGKTASQSFDAENFTISPQLKSNKVIDELSEWLTLKSLEEFEIGNRCINGESQEDNEWSLCSHGSWIPYFQGISLWTKLTRLTMDSIASLRSLHQFKMLTLGCSNLSHLRLRSLGPKGHCSYAKDIALALPHCKALKHFRLEQPHISDFVKDLLIALSNCSQLESICITNNNVMSKIQLKKKENFRAIILKVVTNCPNLSFLLVALPDVSAETCKKIKNWIAFRISRWKDSRFTMEFCTNPQYSSSSNDKYHHFPKFPRDYCLLEKLQWHSNVALLPPLRRQT